MASNCETFWEKRSFAVVGHAAKGAFPKLTYRGLKKLGKVVFPVDPSMDRIDGETAYPDLDSATATMRRGTCDYITKPFKQEELIEAVDRACQRMGIIYRDEQELNRLIGQRIRSHRLSQNLTLRQLSDRTDLTTSQLSQVELGKNAASIWALARISNSLGLRLAKLLDGL